MYSTADNIQENNTILDQSNENKSINYASNHFTANNSQDINPQNPLMIIYENGNNELPSVETPTLFNNPQFSNIPNFGGCPEFWQPDARNLSTTEIISPEQIAEKQYMTNNTDKGGSSMHYLNLNEKKVIIDNQTNENLSKSFSGTNNKKTASLIINSPSKNKVENSPKISKSQSKTNIKKNEFISSNSRKDISKDKLNSSNDNIEDHYYNNGERYKGDF